MPFHADPDFVRALPKAELHAHLSGSISKETLHDIWLRKRSKAQCLDLEDPLTAIRPGGEGFVDLVSFFPLFDKYIYNLCNEAESVKFATEQVIKDFKNDGVRYLELRTTPRDCAETGLKWHEYVEAVNEVIHQCNQNHETELEVFLIISIDRRMTAEQAMEVVDLAIKYQYHLNNTNCYVVGVDLCGDPTKGDVSSFTPAFLRARGAKLGITVHFAEVPQSGTDNELATILSWKPDRLGHCIHVSPKFMNIICGHHLGLELCLSCNVLARLTTGGFAEHHLNTWVMRDNPIALCTDDVGVFGSPLSHEYLLVAEHFLDSEEDLVELSASAVSIAFAGRKRMGRILDEFLQGAGLNKTASEFVLLQDAGPSSNRVLNYHEACVVESRPMILSKQLEFKYSKDDAIAALQLDATRPRHYVRNPKLVVCRVALNMEYVAIIHRSALEMLGHDQMTQALPQRTRTKTTSNVHLKTPRSALRKCWKTLNNRSSVCCG